MRLSKPFQFKTRSTRITPSFWDRPCKLFQWARNNALFLDGDGVIDVDRCYVDSRETRHFQDGIYELCRAAQALGYLLVVITNQAVSVLASIAKQSFWL
jgi:hypothetical protein